MPTFKKFGKAVRRGMVPAVIIFFIVLVPAYLASNSNSFYYGSAHMYGAGTRYGRDTQTIEDIFGEQDTYVILVPEGDLATEKELSAALHEIPEVTSVISYVDSAGAEIPYEYLDENTLSQLESGNYSRFVITAQVERESKAALALTETLRATAETYYGDTYYLAGEGASTYDLMETVTADMVKVNFIAIVAIFLVLLVMLRRPLLSAILVLSIETAIWINLSVPYFMDKTIFYISYLIISSIQLGATVDYAILLTNRYREFRRELPKKEAVVKTISSVSVSVLTSASVLCVCGFLMGKMSSHGVLAQLGFFLGRGALLSLLIVLFVLPGLLCLTDRRKMGKSADSGEKNQENSKKSTECEEVGRNETSQG